MPDRRAPSRIPRFYELSPVERVSRLVEIGALGPAEAEIYLGAGLGLEQADRMIENVVSTFALPCAVAVNFRIDGEDRLVPLVVEEPSVVAALSNTAKLAREAGGFRTDADPGVMVGQIQLAGVRDPEGCARRLVEAVPTLAEAARSVHPEFEALGGGLRGMEVRRVDYEEPGEPREAMVILEFFFDCVDAMGANTINTVAESLGPRVAAIAGETLGLCILTNLADRRLARASVAIPPDALATSGLPGAEVASRIAAAWRFAWADPYRAATHNKGVMNGIDAVAIATGNDWRAIEAGAHAYCCREGRYRPMTRWRVDGDGRLEGRIEVPLQMGTVGGTIRVHPTVRANLALLGARSARDLCAVTAAVGLAQNLGALRALATDGIQAGHMRMHARATGGGGGRG